MPPVTQYLILTSIFWATPLVFWWLCLRVFVPRLLKIILNWLAQLLFEWLMIQIPYTKTAPDWLKVLGMANILLFPCTEEAKQSQAGCKAQIILTAEVKLCLRDTPGCFVCQIWIQYNGKQSERKLLDLLTGKILCEKHRFSPARLPKQLLNKKWWIWPKIHSWGNNGTLV